MPDQLKQGHPEIWGQENEGREALQQVVDLCRKGFSFDLDIAPSGTAFYRREDGRQPDRGVLDINGGVNEAVVSIRLQLVRGGENLRVCSTPFFTQLAKLGERVRLIPPRQDGNGETSLWVELNVHASPMSLARANVFMDELKRLDLLARTLQEELPASRSNLETAELFKDFDETLAPVEPLDANFNLGNLGLSAWLADTLDFLAASSSVALACPHEVSREFAVAALATTGLVAGQHFGRLLQPSINAAKLLNLTARAPGIVVIPAVRMSVGSSPYELGNEMTNLLSALASANTPVIFTGGLEQLQAVFSGGQGGAANPLQPIVRHVPEIAMTDLVRFAVQGSAARHGGIPQRVEAELTQQIQELLGDLSPDERRTLLGVVTNKVLKNWIAGGKEDTAATKNFVGRVSTQSETLAGLSSRPRGSRVPSIQERFTRVLAAPDRLLAQLQQDLLAQDRALTELTNRLAMEVLTRPQHQPIRYCAQGTPATGKSESAVLLARYLEIPYVNIDAASMPDYHTAASQLLGSGRGIVMSHQAGRLEQVAKHHAGALIEISDLDHANPSVRSALADLFLQVLETGEAQSATGAMFSCANLIFAFTMNLPGGLDEAVRKGMGFINQPSRKEVGKRVSQEIRMMLSSAFLSRVGTPILFEPLDGKALAVVVEKAVVAAITAAAQRLHCPIGSIRLEEGLGLAVIAATDPNIGSYGARGLLEQGRAMAARAFLDLVHEGADFHNRQLIVSTGGDGQIVITTS